VLRQLELHYVPKHANWLDMVEIEIGCSLPHASVVGIESIE
jgi:hypothetical protein